MGAPPQPDIGDLFRLLAAQAPEHAFIFLDPEGRVIWWSTGAERIFGYTAAQIAGQPLAVIFTPEDRAEGVPEFERAVALGGNGAEDDRWQLRRDGSRFWATGILVALREPGGRLAGFGKVLRDRTDLKEQLETLRNVARELEAAARRKDVFLSTLSHELRNPLAPIANALQVMRMGATPVSPEADYALKVIERQAHLLERLVGDLLDLTRVGAGKVELRRERLALQEILGAALEDVADLMRQRNHSVDTVLAEAPVCVDGDRDRLHQVAVNLLTNAAKYTPPGGRIQVKVAREAEEAVLRVEDNGVGIPPEMQPRIFELFTQVESARSQADGGLGIGLALVKDLVSQHGGSVQVRSDGPGKGAEFIVRLPLAPPSASLPR